MPAWRKGPEKVCEECGIHFHAQCVSRSDRSRFCSRECLGNWTVRTKEFAFRGPHADVSKQAISNAMSLDKNPNWKGGRSKRKDGYWVNSVGSGQQKLEHRVITEKILGRPLASSECVHHINMDKSDNRKVNFLICSKGYNTWLVKRYAELYAKEHFNSCT